MNFTKASYKTLLCHRKFNCLKLMIRKGTGNVSRQYATSPESQVDLAGQLKLG